MISRRLIFSRLYYTSVCFGIIYFSPMRCILLSDRGLFYPAYSKENAESVVGRTLESFEHSVSPLLLVVHQRELRREAPTRAYEYAAMCVPLRAECVRRTDFIVHVVWHQCKIWGWFQTHDKAISNWITDFWAHNKMHLPRRFPKPRKGI